MKRAVLFILTLIVASGVFTPPVHAATTFQVAGWIPYWAVDAGIADATIHLNQLTQLHPFSYSVKQDGTLKDLATMGSSAWQTLIASARVKGVKIVPTVMWSDTPVMETTLNNPILRAAHVRAVAALANGNNYDGIDIDYEAKSSATKPGFSAFLKELKVGLGNRLLVCTIEARTPPSSLFATPPKDLGYANDYAAINKYCDQVEIMAYDQGRIDLSLNASKSGEPYDPIADTDWVKKVMQLTVKTIKPSKLFISVATYGREYELTVAPNAFQNYATLWSVTDAYAKSFAASLNITPERNKAGELSYSYVATTSPVYATLTPPTSSTQTGNVAAANTLAYASSIGKIVNINYVSWSDAIAVAQKVSLAKSLKLAGIAIFKLDGKEDQNLWNSL